MQKPATQANETAPIRSAAYHRLYSMFQKGTTIGGTADAFTLEATDNTYEASKDALPAADTLHAGLKRDKGKGKALEKKRKGKKVRTGEKTIEYKDREDERSSSKSHAVAEHEPLSRQRSIEVSPDNVRSETKRRKVDPDRPKKRRKRHREKDAGTPKFTEEQSTTTSKDAKRAHIRRAQ